MEAPGQPNLLEADKDAEYAAVIETDLGRYQEPTACCPNDPDDAKFLSEVAGTKIDEAYRFVHDQHRSLPRRSQVAKASDIPCKLVVAPPTGIPERADQGRPLRRLRYRRCKRTEMPGCSLHGQPICAREGATVISTSTRNFLNCLGKNTNVPRVRRTGSYRPRLGKLPFKRGIPPGNGVIDADKASVPLRTSTRSRNMQRLAKGVTA